MPLLMFFCIIQQHSNVAASMRWLALLALCTNQCFIASCMNTNCSFYSNDVLNGHCADENLMDAKADESGSNDELSVLQTNFDLVNSTKADEDVQNSELYKTLGHSVTSLGELERRQPNLFTHSMLSFWDLDFRIEIVEIAVLLIVVLFREIALARNWFGRQEITSTHRWYMKAVEVLRVQVAACDYAFIIPVSLNLAKGLGEDLILSSFIVGAFAGGVALGAVIVLKIKGSASHCGMRRLLILSLAFSAMCEAALAVMMTIPDMQSAGSLTIAILIVRFIAGVASGIGCIHLAMLCQVCTQKELAQLEAWKPAARLFGLALGPLFVALCATRLFPRDYFQASSTPMMGIAVMNMMLSVSVSFKLPLDLGQVSTVHEAQTRTLEVAGRTPGAASTERSTNVPNANHGVIEVQSCMQICMYAFITAGIEVGMSYRSEVNDGWKPVRTAFGMSIVFAGTCVIVFVVAILCRFSELARRILTVPFALIATALTLLYFPGAEYISGQYHLLVADLFVYSCTALATERIAGFTTWAWRRCVQNSNLYDPQREVYNAQLEQNVHNKWRSHFDNVLCISLALEGITRLLAAPAARWIIFRGGSKPYAILQLILTSLSLLNVLWTKNYMYMTESDPDECAAAIHVAGKEKGPNSARSNGSSSRT